MSAVRELIVPLDRPIVDHLAALDPERDCLLSGVRATHHLYLFKPITLAEYRAGLGVDCAHDERLNHLYRLDARVLDPGTVAGRHWLRATLDWACGPSAAECARVCRLLETDPAALAAYADDFDGHVSYEEDGRATLAVIGERLRDAPEVDGNWRRFVVPHRDPRPFDPPAWFADELIRHAGYDRPPRPLSADFVAWGRAHAPKPVEPLALWRGIRVPPGTSASGVAALVEGRVGTGDAVVHDPGRATSWSRERPIAREFARPNDPGALNVLLRVEARPHEVVLDTALLPDALHARLTTATMVEVVLDAAPRTVVVDEVITTAVAEAA